MEARTKETVKRLNKCLLKLVRITTALLNSTTVVEERVWDEKMRGEALTDAKKWLELIKPK